MRMNILIGGKAGQGINKVSKIISDALNANGYFTFNYRDYPSIIRGGHNFNIISISDTPIASHESVLDGIIAIDKNTAELHAHELKKEGFVLTYERFAKFGLNSNLALTGALTKILGIKREGISKAIAKDIVSKEALVAFNEGYESEEKRFSFNPLKNKISVLSGNEAVSIGAINSGIDAYFAYPMTPATNLLHDLASKQKENKFIVFPSENEISVVNMALGASFAGAKAMVGTSGGGFDLMTEALSLQGISEIPLVVYLASRAGPGTGVPTYSMQGDLDVALRGGHGEFPRVVIAPGDPIESSESVNWAFYLSQKYNALSIILSDKHLAESEFSSVKHAARPIPIKVTRKIPGEGVVRATSYEHDANSMTIESPSLTKSNAEKRIKKYLEIKKECKKFDMVKIHGDKNSRNLVIGWGSTKGAITDAIRGEDFKFLQVLFVKPLSDEIRKEIQKAKRVILVENNVTGQLGRLIREKTGIKIEKRILKYDGRPFTSDELKKELLKTK